MSSTEQEPEANQPSRAVQYGLVAVAIFVLLYSTVILTRPFFGVTVIVWMVGLYLLWRFFHLASRFVRAVERIADSMEARDGE